MKTIYKDTEKELDAEINAWLKLGMVVWLGERVIIFNGGKKLFAQSVLLGESS